jgi:hypothetical protein
VGVYDRVNKKVVGVFVRFRAPLHASLFISQPFHISSKN